jgi:hypothetical protein
VLIVAEYLPPFILHSFCESVDQILQRLELLSFHQIEFDNEKVKMFEAGVQVRLLSQRHDFLPTSTVRKTKKQEKLKN